MKERLQKVIAHAGIASRRKAEEMILAKRVKVNGIVIDQLGATVDENDKIQIDNKTIKRESKVIYMINKPLSVLSSASDDRERVVVVDLINDQRRLYPVGRLDYNSSGLLLVTNDGEFAQKVIHPSSHIPKEYHVKVRGQLTQKSIDLLHKGLRTKEESYYPVKISSVKVDTEKKITHFDIILYEGKNRQIRKMMEHLHHDVLKLHRFRIGPLQLGKLASGQYRKLTEEEVTRLLQSAGKK